MEHSPWDAPLCGVWALFDSHVGHYVIAVAVLISLVGWIFSPHGTGLRKLIAVAFGGAVAMAVNVLLMHFFPAGPIPPGGMP